MAYALDQLGRYLENIRENSTRLRTEVTPAHGSLAAQEAASVTSEQRDFIRQGILLANARLVVAEEHLATVGRCVRDPSTLYSVYTVARATSEIAALAWWLLNPKISAMERAGRSVGQRLYSIKESGDLPVGEARRTAQARRRHLLSKAAAAGVTPVYVGSVTDLVGAVHSTEAAAEHVDDERDVGRLLYKMHSAFTHGTAYAIQYLMRHASDDAGSPVPVAPDVDEDTVWMQVYTDAKTEVVAVMGALLPYLAAAKAFMAYTGRDSETWRSYIVYTLGEARHFLPSRPDA